MSTAEAGARVHAGPLDPVLATLVRSVAPDAAADLDVHVVKHRPGRRSAVFVGESEPAPGGRRVCWGVIVKRGTAARVKRLANIYEALGRALPPDAATPRAPRMLGARPERGWLALVAWPGGALAAEFDPALRCVALEGAARALASLERDRHARNHWPGRRWTVAKERVRLEETGMPLERRLGTAAHPLLEAAMGSVADADVVPAHRDLNAEQIVVGSGEPGTRWVDWDEAAWAPAGLDLGNLLAHERLAHVRGVLGAAALEMLRARTLAAYAASGGTAGTRTVESWEALACLRLAGLAAGRLAGNDPIERHPEWVVHAAPDAEEPELLLAAAAELLMPR
jgi:aminoglycoside phosphotransferase (APT) family kinase protein